MESLADFLGIETGGLAPQTPAPPLLEDIADPKAFAQAVLSSLEFRQYILNALSLGELPAAVICRLMDYAWGAPPKRVEHTGKDGQPIETVTEVRRVIIRVGTQLGSEEDERPVTTH